MNYEQLAPFNALAFVNELAAWTGLKNTAWQVYI